MLITAVLMIKNEAHVIAETLQSLIPCFKNIFILDTGSSDDTVNITKTFFTTHNIQGYIAEEAFIDFATSRNRALQLAREQFPDTVFFLMLDAEWYLHHPEALIAFCEQEAAKTTSLYLLKIKMGSLDFTTARLLRASASITFKGVVHEVPDIPAYIQVPAPCYIEVKASHQGQEKSKQRWKRDAELLIKSYEVNPQDVRSVFYLAQTYHCLGELEKAYEFYQIREKLVGWDEENFMTLFRLGCIAQELAKWPIALDYYFKAHAYRPSRIEPLIKLADYYWPENIPMCYLFAQRAYHMPYPHNDILFIEKEMYTYTRYEIMSRAAWYLGEYELGEEASLLALKVHPEMEHLHNNLKLYQEKIKSKTLTVA